MQHKYSTSSFIKFHFINAIYTQVQYLEMLYIYIHVILIYIYESIIFYIGNGISFDSMVQSCS